MTQNDIGQTEAYCNEHSVQHILMIKLYVYEIVNKQYL